MQRNFMTITYAYHFIAEAIIILFLSIPFFHYYYDTIPYLSYSAIICILTCVYVVLLHRVTSYIPYLIITSVLVGIFYVLAYPLWINIAFAVLLTNSSISLRKENKLENEGLYLRIILIASIIIPLFIHDVSFVIFVVLSLLLLIVGNILRNMTMLPKEDRRSRSTWFLMSMLGVIVVAITIMYFSFNWVRMAVGFVWGLITTVLAQLGGFLVYLISLIPIPEPLDDEEEEPDMGMGESPPEFYDDSETLVEQAFTWILIVICIIAAYFIIRLVLRLMKQSFDRKAFTEDHVSYEHIEGVEREKKSWKNRLKNLIPQPKDHVRKRMFQFEKAMKRTGNGRKQEETLEEWIRRMGWDIDFAMYQRVRYGTFEGTKEQAKQLKQQMDSIIEDMREKHRKTS